MSALGGGSKQTHVMFPGSGFNLDEGERRTRSEGLVLVLDLVGQVLLHPFLLEDLLLAVGAEQDARGDGDGHCVLRLGLPNHKQTKDSTAESFMRSRWSAMVIETAAGQHSRRRRGRYERNG